MSATDSCDAVAVREGASHNRASDVASATEDEPDFGRCWGGSRGWGGRSRKRKSRERERWRGERRGGHALDYCIVSRRLAALQLGVSRFCIQCLPIMAGMHVGAETKAER